MARLSGYLTGRMANPTYGGMLSQNIHGGMQGISDAIAQRKQRDAFDSITSMLSGADPTDPRVVESAQAVGRQMQQDPLVVQQLINQQQAQQRQQEQAQRAQEQAVRAQANHQMIKATHEYNQQMRANKTADDNAIKGIMSVYSKDPEAARAALDKLPPERQEAAATALAKRIQYDAQLAAWDDTVKSRKPLTDAQLESMSKLPGMETAIETYKSMKEEPGAKANLLRQYNQAFQASLYSSSSDGLKSWEVKAAEKLVEGADWGIPGLNIPNRHYGQTAYAVAQWIKDNGRPPTPDEIREIARQAVKGAVEKEEPEDPSSPSGKPEGVGPDWVLVEDAEGNKAWMAPDGEYIEVD